MEMLLGFLSLLSFSWLLVGLVSPTKAMFWARKRTRLRVLGWYVVSVFVIGGAIQIFVPKPTQTQAEQASPASAQSALPPEAAPATATSQPVEPAATAPAKEPKPRAVPAVDAAKLAEEKAVREKAEAQATEESKAKVRTFEKDLRGYDTVSALYMENAKAMTKRLGKDASMGDLYQALKQARQYAQAGANAVLQLQVPAGLPEPVEAALQEAKEASWQMLIGRRKSLEAFMDWVENRKPSAQAKMQEESSFSSLQAAKCVEALLKAKVRAGLNGD